MDQQVKQERLQGRLGPEIKEFRQERRTLQLATVDAEGRPNVSYAPYVQTRKVISFSFLKSLVMPVTF